MLGRVTIQQSIVVCGLQFFFFDIDRPTSSAIGQICSESESEVYAVFAHS